MAITRQDLATKIDEVIQEAERIRVQLEEENHRQVSEATTLVEDLEAMRTSLKEHDTPDPMLGMIPGLRAMAEQCVDELARLREPLEEGARIAETATR